MTDLSFFIVWVIFATIILSLALLTVLVVAALERRWIRRGIIKDEAGHAYYRRRR